MEDTRLRRICVGVAVLLLTAASSHAQTALTESQRSADLNQLTAFYAKNYAPYEWKRDLFGVDLLRLNEWFQAIHKANDLDFQEVLIDYVTSLNDAHVGVWFPSNFQAVLPLRFDIYDGRILIDSIDRAALPLAQFPFGIGDELMAFDGVPVRDAIAALRKYANVGVPHITDRFAADSLSFRSQAFLPHAPDLGDTAALRIRLNSSGVENTWLVPWFKSGTAMTSQGPVPSPGRQPYRLTSATPAAAITEPSEMPAPPASSRYRRADTGVADDTLPAYMEPLRPLLNASIAREPEGVLGFGAKTPTYTMPPGFVRRRGGPSSDFFLTGTFPAGGRTVGFIRIPSFAPPSTSVALQQLDQEIAFFNANTDGLVIDVMRNPGGNILFCESILQRLMPAPFRTLGFEIRATATWLVAFANSADAAQLSNAPPQVIENLRNNYQEILRAYNEQRGRSAPVSLNSTGSLTLNPAAVRYAKPLLVLIDEWSASAGDMFAAIVQDNQRGPLFGMRTMGAGGSVKTYQATAYTESSFTITVSLANRGHVIQTSDYPPAPYIENIGVRPDILNNYMTRDNLMTGGASFVQAFSAAIVALIQTP